MAEATARLPIHDTLEALRNSFRVTLIESQFDNPKHLEALRAINVQSADEGQLSLETVKPEPMTDAGVEKWAKKEFGDFKFVSRLLVQGERIIGEEHDYTDTHISDVNAALSSGGLELRLDSATHVETCTFILAHTRDRAKMDEYAGVLQLAELFHLDPSSETPDRGMQTAAVYIDHADQTDRDTMKRVGYGVSIDDIPYEDGPATVFIATRASAEAAVYAYADSLGISSHSAHEASQ